MVNIYAANDAELFFIIVTGEDSRQEKIQAKVMAARLAEARNEDRRAAKTFKGDKLVSIIQ